MDGSMTAGARSREILARVAKLRRARVTLNEDEIRVLYALAQHDAEGRHGCTLADAPDAIAGPHEEHAFAVLTALAKLADAVADIQERATR